MKKDSSIIGCFLLVGQLIFQGAVILAVLAATLLGIPELGITLGSDAGSLLANGLLLGVLYLMRLRTLTRPDGCTSTGDTVRLCLFALLSLFLWNMLCSSLDTLTGHLFSAASDGSSSGTLLYQLVTMAAFPAVVEEFAFRKVIFGIMRKYGFAIAAFFSSLCFGLMHQNFPQLLFAFGMGILLCSVYEQTGTIACGIILHFFNNALSVLLSQSSLYRSIGSWVELAVSTIGIPLFFIFIIRPLISDRETSSRKKTYQAAETIRSTSGMPDQAEEPIRKSIVMSIRALQLRSELAACLVNIPMLLYSFLCIGIAVSAVILKL